MPIAPLAVSALGVFGIVCLAVVIVLLAVVAFVAYQVRQFRASMRSLGHTLKGIGNIVLGNPYQGRGKAVAPERFGRLDSADTIAPAVEGSAVEPTRGDADRPRDSR